jgi:ABC-2 type transport system ATP-binding protein
MSSIVSIKNLSKTYASGHQALKNVSLEIERGEILALLGPNGAGKTTLISAVCGIVRPTGGSVTVDGNDIVRDWRAARRAIGLVPQEIALEIFETPWNTIKMSRGLFGLKHDAAKIEAELRSLSLWDKVHEKNMTLSGGMKRRVMIARALVHEPRILFLDEPSAGVDVELRQDMWEVVKKLRDDGVTIILTTHYIEEAEAMADRVGIINNGELVLVEDKASLMKKLGQKRLFIELDTQISALPPKLAKLGVTLADDQRNLQLVYDSEAAKSPIPDLIAALSAEGIALRDLRTEQSSLEDIFVSLVRRAA